MNTPKIVFETISQKVLWDCIYRYQFQYGVWANSIIHNKMLWVRATTEVASNESEIGTTIPKFEKRYQLYRDDLMFDIGWKAIAVVRYVYVTAKYPTNDVMDMIDHLIRIDFSDENKDYRKSQVLSEEEIMYKVKHSFNESSRKNFYALKENIQKQGTSIKQIIDALKVVCYCKRDLNSDMTSMDKIIRKVQNIQNV